MGTLWINLHLIISAWVLELWFLCQGLKRKGKEKKKQKKQSCRLLWGLACVAVSEDHHLFSYNSEHVSTLKPVILWEMNSPWGEKEDRDPQE